VIKEPKGAAIVLCFFAVEHDLIPSQVFGWRFQNGKNKLGIFLQDLLQRWKERVHKRVEHRIRRINNSRR
jgi:hypothetical protein